MGLTRVPESLRAFGFDIIESGTTCDIGSKGKSVVTISGTIQIGNFGNSIRDGETILCRIASAGLILAPSSNLILNYSNVASGYYSLAGDWLKVTRVGTSSGTSICLIEIVRANGLASTSTTNSGFVGLGISPYGADPNTGILIDHITELTLLEAQDQNQTGVNASHALRCEDILNRVMSTAYVGDGGMDAGTVSANADIFGWCVSDGSSYQLRFSHSISWPTMPAAGWNWAAPFYWNRTDGSAHLRKLTKIGHEVSYREGSEQLLYSATRDGVTVGHVNLALPAGFASPTAEYTLRFRVEGGTTVGKRIIVGNDSGTALARVWSAANPEWAYVEVCGYAGGACVNNDDPAAAKVYLVGFRDVI